MENIERNLRQVRQELNRDSISNQEFILATSQFQFWVDMALRNAGCLHKVDEVRQAMVPMEDMVHAMASGRAHRDIIAHRNSIKNKVREAMELMGFE